MRIVESSLARHAWVALSLWLASIALPGAVQAQPDIADPEPPTVQNAVEAPSGADVEPPQNYLSWAIGALGWGYLLVFLLLSFTLVALIAMNLLTARRDNVCPQDLIEEFDAHLDQKQYQEAYDLARNDDSFLGLVLSAGLAKLSSDGYSEAIEAMQEVGEEETMKLEHRLSYMGLIGKISPMIGLLGTVHGMILSFQTIASSSATVEHQELAGGIATALVTTLIGLFIAIPAIAAYDILRNRVSRLVMEVGIRSEELMSRFRSREQVAT